MRAARGFILVLAAGAAIATAAPAAAQGRGGGNGRKSTPPSSSPLPSAAVAPASDAAPMAWLDDATLLPAGAASLTVSAAKWSGTDLGETDFPVVSAAVSLTPRVQFGVSIPRVFGSDDGTGPIGGIGTSYISGKIALLRAGSSMKLAVMPMLEILGEGAVQALPPGESRMQAGLPVSFEVSQGPARVFASAGVFTRGAWFAGAGVGTQATPRVGLLASFTRSWGGMDASGLLRDRRELSGGISYLVAPRVALYGSLGRTIATTDDNGAGTTVGTGVTLLLAPTRVSR
jgi:hypothetical protein